MNFASLIAAPSSVVWPKKVSHIVIMEMAHEKFKKRPSFCDETRFDLINDKSSAVQMIPIHYVDLFRIATLQFIML